LYPEPGGRIIVDPREMNRICVFCGSGSGRDPEYRRAAEACGRLIAARGAGLVYGGSQLGLMGVIADTVAARGGPVTGVVPRLLVEREAAHLGLADLRVVESMHERKALMANLATAFLALPGGFGTFDELFEIVTWAQLGLHSKPIGVLNVRGYFDPLFGMLDRAVAEGFIQERYRGLLISDAEPAALIDRLLRTAACLPSDPPSGVLESG
jgi:uncharacterized protein (TIGR00730 family)